MGAQIEKENHEDLFIRQWANLHWKLKFSTDLNKIVRKNKPKLLETAIKDIWQSTIIIWRTRGKHSKIYEQEVVSLIENEIKAKAKRRNACCCDGQLKGLEFLNQQNDSTIAST